MAKNKISEYSSTAANNTDVANINIAEGCSPSNINNAIRAVMSHLKDLQSGSSGDTIPVTAGGTGSGTASGARTNLGLGALSVLATVDTAQIDDDAITTAKILDANVTNAKMATDSVDTTQIVDDAVTSAKIAANAVDATALNVSGDGTSGQALLSDGDGSFSWGTGSVVTATSGSAPYYGARAWVNFDGTGTPSIRQSANVSSLTDNGIGDYTITFTTALPDSSYAAAISAGSGTGSSGDGTTYKNNTSASSIRVETFTPSGSSAADYARVGVIVFR